MKKKAAPTCGISPQRRVVSSLPQNKKRPPSLLPPSPRKSYRFLVESMTKSTSISFDTFEEKEDDSPLTTWTPPPPPPLNVKVSTYIYLLFSS